MNGRIRLPAFVLFLIVVAGVPASATEELGGWSIAASGTVVGISYDDPAIDVPARPVGEMRLSFTRALLDVGPSGHGLSSAIWPGPLIGDSLPVIMDNFGYSDAPGYPIRADARYPAGPSEASQELAPGTGMAARSEGTDTVARSSLTDFEIPGVGTVGSAFSRSRAYIEENVAIADVRTALGDVNFLDGQLKIGEVVSQARVTSDGKASAVGGTTAIKDLELGGTPIGVTDQGFVIGDEVHEDPIRAMFMGPVNEGISAVGVQVRLLQPEDTTEGAAGSRSAVGLEITLDGKPMREALDQAPLYDIVTALPEDLAVHLFPVLFTSPKIVITLGEISASSAASEAFSFGVPSADEFVAPGAGDPAPAPFSAGSVGNPGMDSVAPAIDTDGAPAPRVSGDAAPVMGAPTAITAPQGYASLPRGLTLLGLVAAVLLGAGMHRVGEGLFTGAAVTATRGCPYGRDET